MIDQMLVKNDSVFSWLCLPPADGTFNIFVNYVHNIL